MMLRKRKTIDQFAFYQTSLKYTKKSYTNKYHLFLITFSQNINADLGKVLALNIV